MRNDLVILNDVGNAIKLKRKVLWDSGITPQMKRYMQYCFGFGFFGANSFLDYQPIPPANVSSWPHERTIVTGAIGVNIVDSDGKVLVPSGATPFAVMIDGTVEFNKDGEFFNYSPSFDLQAFIDALP